MLLKEEWPSTAGYLESAINSILVAGDDLMSSRALQVRVTICDRARRMVQVLGKSTPYKRVLGTTAFVNRDTGEELLLTLYKISYKRCSPVLSV